MKKFIKMSQKSSTLDLCVVIVSYNTRDILDNCLSSLKSVKNVNFETIVVDNNSTDGSLEMLDKYKQSLAGSIVKVVKNDKNIGFGAANNIARKFLNSDYVLFLNSDTIVNKNSLKEPLQYIKDHQSVGAITCKVVLPNGRFDKDTRRSFPTPWVAFTHFTGLDRIFPRSRILAKYWYGYEDLNNEHEVDVIQGAYFLTRKATLDKVGWFDEDYFLDGEDIDLCWKIKSKGLKIMYYPKVKITHIKKASKKTDQKQSLSSVLRGVEAMKIFYRKRLWKKYPFYVNYAILFGIVILKALRSIKYYIKI